MLRPWIPVYLHFILNRPKLVWCCHFFEDDPKVSPKSIQAFPSAGSILGMAKRGRADDKAVGRQMTRVVVDVGCVSQMNSTVICCHVVEETTEECTMRPGFSIWFG